MKILGIDYGESKIGLAISEGILVEPLGVVGIRDIRDEILDVCRKESIERIVVGLPEGKLLEKAKQFGNMLRKLTGVLVEFQDETLTTWDAIAKMKEVGKRLKKEDAIAAAVILQGYLETHKINNV